MGLWDSIKSKVFGQHEAPAVAPSTSTPAAPASQKTAAAPAAPAPAAAAPAAPAPAATASTTAQSVDVTAILDKAVADKGQKLDWRHSIVDLLKSIDVDSSLTARKALAGELGYSGSTDDSATMNIWLHKAVIKKLSDNGGKVPADLLD